MAEKNAAKKKNSKIASFFKGLKSEIKKIAWPNRETTLKQTAAVVIISLILCGFIRLIDVLAQLAVGAVSSIF
ncbi:MAG: preprotein translocase subunit SecE [Lachnospiraceae bacterium]|nr:preprotein translocase subunit SecE [Lachnospiraceae bacterium]MBQ7601381.1 preprotein translocase subunit SecE [Lachnospiraceae bacterium]